jgi:hypothetical protein
MLTVEYLIVAAGAFAAALTWPPTSDILNNLLAF